MTIPWIHLGILHYFPSKVGNLLPHILVLCYLTFWCCVTSHFGAVLPHILLLWYLTFWCCVTSHFGAVLPHILLLWYLTFWCCVTSHFGAVLPRILVLCYHTFIGKCFLLLFYSELFLIFKWLQFNKLWIRSIWNILDLWQLILFNFVHRTCLHCKCLKYITS